jgi:Zn-dependent protease/CBS domain-containing protein
VFRERNLTLGRIGGVEVRVGVSWFVVVALVTWSFWDRFNANPRFHGATAFVMAASAAVLLLGSVLAHELAHALEARYRGVPVGGITLFLFGGVTETSMEARRPVDEFALTAVGPFTSLAAGAAFGLLSVVFRGVGLDAPAFVLGDVGWLNVGLAVFNLLPGAPLDGGRILRAVAWRVTGDRARATIIAARAGWAVGTLIFTLGLFQVFFVPSAFVNGLWMAFIGWFLVGAAATEAGQAQLRRALAHVPVRRLFGRRAETVPADVSVAEAIEGWFRPLGADAFLVADETGAVVGVLTLDDVRGAVPDRPVREVMRSLDDVPRIQADASAVAALDALAPGGPGSHVVLVEDDGQLLGVVTSRTLLTQLRRQQELESALGAGR